MPEDVILWVLFLLVAFFLGSVPFGKLIGKKVSKVDVTQKGSGNIGATNVARVVGMKWGIFTLFLDILKGFIPTFLFGMILSGSEHGAAMIGLSALLGHQFSIFQKFRGGKGVATALGAYLAISPLSCGIALVVFIGTVYFSDYVSLGSIISALLMPFLLILFDQPANIFIPAFIMAVLICAKHHGNIQRLIQGKENRWSRRKIMKEAQADDSAHHQNRNG